MPYCRQGHVAGNGERARLTADEADGADAKFRASHAYSSCFPTISLFCCPEQSKRGKSSSVASAPQPEGCRWAGWAGCSREGVYVCSDVEGIGNALEAGTPAPLFATRVGGAVQIRSANNITEDSSISPITVVLNWKPNPTQPNPTHDLNRRQGFLNISRGDVGVSPAAYRQHRAS